MMFSLVLFRATSSASEDPANTECDYKTFEEVQSMSSISEIYPKASKAPYSHFTSFNWFVSLNRSFSTKIRSINFYALIDFD